jgi:tRNA (cmo5U34)-methyltransferase
MAQFHFDPDTYLEMVRAEVPGYDELQAAIGRAAATYTGTDAPRVLDLGAGTGSTARAVLAAQPNAQLVLVDENPGMLAIAQDVLPAANIEHVVIADLTEPFPEGPFDLVVSALAIHHLDGAEKRALFARVHERLRAGGVFAMADVVVPDDPADAVTPLTDGYDKPDRFVDLAQWLTEAGFETDAREHSADLAVFVARR